MTDLMMALGELRAARPAYEEARTYYKGLAKERYASAFMQRLLGGSESFRINLACRPVDAVLDRLEISAVTCEPDAATAVFKEQVWDANDLDLEAPQIHKAALMFGDSYLFAWESEPPADEDEAELEDGDQVVGGVDVFYNSPLVARIIYDAENPRRKRLAIKSWCEGEGADERIRVNLYYPHRVEKYISKAKTKGEKDDQFEPFVDDHTDNAGVMPNPYGAIPFFHFRTEGPYGVPEHMNAFGPQDALTKLVTNMMSSSDFTALPQRYGLIEGREGTDDDIDWSDDDSTSPEDKDSQLTSAPGSFWALKHYKEVGQFAPGDSDNFLKPMSAIVRLMAAVTSTPLRWFDPTSGVPSGASIRADEAPLNKKVTFRSMWFGATWREFGTFALKILGHPATVTVRWANPQTVEDLEFWQMVNEKQDAGVPVRQSLLDAGIPEQLVEAWGYTEDKPNGDGSLEELFRDEESEGAAA
jgi:hypothetical protein